MTSVPVSPTKDDIIEYLRPRLDEDETPDLMDENLEADILGRIPDNLSEMYVWAMVPTTHNPLTDMHLGFY